jgi:ADP-ribose pyrophosphatase YjhB (NUDIX family)
MSNNHPRLDIPREYRDAPLVGVGALIWRTDTGQVLLVQRGREPSLGMWALPGGLVEIGETLAEALVREVAEETGLAVRPGPFIDSFEPILRDDDGRVRFHYVVLDYLAFWDAGEPLAGDDASAVGWFVPTALDALPMSPATRAMVHKGITLAQAD